MRRFVAFLFLVTTLIAQAAPGELLGRPLGELPKLRWLTADGKAPPPAPTIYRWWTVGCPFCRDSLPDLSALARQHAAQGLRLVAVFHNKSPQLPDDAALRGYLAGLGVDAVLARDDDWTELRPLMARGALDQATSISLLVDADGVVRHADPGPRLHERAGDRHPEAAAAFAQLRTAVTALLGEVVDVAFDAKVPARQLQLWLPPAPAPGFPTLMFVVGSGFRTPGELPAGLAAALQREGIAVALVRHRLGAARSWRLAMGDVAAAFGWLHQHIQGRGGAPERIVVGGHGAGAWAATLLGTDPAWLQPVGRSPRDLAGVLALSPFLDLRPAEGGRGRRFGDVLLRDGDGLVFGDDEAELAAATPATHVAREVPAFFGIVGAGDLPMLLRDANTFAAAVRDAGGHAVTVRASGRRHGQVVHVVDDRQEPLREQVLAFLRDPVAFARDAGSGR